MWPCGVISVKDSSSAYITSTPVESFMPPGMPRSSTATSPGWMPASGAKKRLLFGQNDGKSRFQTAITCCGVDVGAHQPHAVGLLPHPAEALDRRRRPAAGHVDARRARLHAGHLEPLDGLRPGLAVSMCSLGAHVVRSLQAAAASAPASSLWMPIASSSRVSSKIWR